MLKIKEKLIKWLGGTVQITSHDKVKIVHRTYSSIPIKVCIYVPVDELFDVEDADELAKEELTQRLAEHIVKNKLLAITKEKDPFSDGYTYCGKLYVVTRE